MKFGSQRLFWSADWHFRMQSHGRLDRIAKAYDEARLWLILKNVLGYKGQGQIPTGGFAHPACQSRASGNRSSSSRIQRQSPLLKK
jgi:hypothetical protein